MMSENAFKVYIDDGCMLSNEQLQAALDQFTKILKRRQDAEREELRIKLMENLQKAIGDILHNGFQLTIQNADYPDLYAKFCPDDIYHIEMK